MRADQVIAPQSNAIAVKTTASHALPGSADSFGQILQCARDAAPAPVAEPSHDAPSPRVLAAKATPPHPHGTATDPAAAIPKAVNRSGIAASEGAGTQPTQPASALRNASHPVARQPADQTAEKLTPTVEPAAATVAQPAALPAQDAAALLVSPSPPSVLPVVAQPTESAAATQATPCVNVANPKAVLDRGTVSAAPAPCPAVSTSVVSAAGRPSPESIQAAFSDASASRGLLSVAAGEGTAKAGKDFQRLRTVENPARSRQTMPVTANQGASSQTAPGAAQPKIPPTSLAGAPSHAPEADGTTPWGPSSANGITFRPVEAPAAPIHPAALSPSPLGQAVPFDLSAAIPATASAATTQQVHTGNPASPAEQVRPALMTLAKSTDGSQEVTIRLQPGDLGTVQIRIARAASGATRIEILAEKPATLLTLQRDQPQLHRALDEAGIPAAGRAVSFHEVPPAHATNRDGSSSGPAGQHGSAAGHAGASNDANVSAGGGNGNNPAKKPNSYSNRSSFSSPAATIAANAATITQTYHIGLDITA